jgi:hypothetical protein
MKKDIYQAGKNEIKKDKHAGSKEQSKDLHQEDEKIITDKISEDRNIGGLTERDDAPGSGINSNDPTEHTLGNP